MDFCQKKTTADEIELEQGQGEVWIWTAIDTSSRMIVNFRVGSHLMEDARIMVQELKSSLSDPLPMFVSDELPHYANVLEEAFSRLEQVPRTGKPGRPAKPKRVVDPELMYTTVKKTRKQGRVVKVERKVVFGDKDSIAERLAASPGKVINTSYIERSNLSWRLWDAHLHRKTLTFAKSLRWLNAKLAICIVWYNFVRQHNSLTQSVSGYTQKLTPAMAAGITDRAWTFEELLDSSLFVN